MAQKLSDFRIQLSFCYTNYTSNYVTAPRVKDEFTDVQSDVYDSFRLVAGASQLIGTVFHRRHQSSRRFRLRRLGQVHPRLRLVVVQQETARSKHSLIHHTQAKMNQIRLLHPRPPEGAYRTAQDSLSGFKDHNKVAYIYIYTYIHIYIYIYIYIYVTSYDKVSNAYYNR